MFNISTKFHKVLINSFLSRP